MSGAEAWSLVAPILIGYVGTNEEGGLNRFGEAYMLIFDALREHDRRNEGDTE